MQIFYTTIYHFIIYATINLLFVIFSKTLLKDNYPKTFGNFSESNYLKENKGVPSKDVCNAHANSNKNVRFYVFNASIFLTS